MGDKINVAMEVIRSSDALRQRLAGFSSAGRKIGFVPTMGALHQGHISLIKHALGENDVVVASIFVNPTQFNDPKDFDRYPVSTENDIRMLEDAGCTLLFLPSPDEIYPPDAPKPVVPDLGKLDRVMEGQFRPGHFSGVAMVLERFFSLVQPHQAYFGEKDYQQLMVVKHLAALRFPDLTIRPVPTMREKDGLAMSSRNLLLTPEDRRNASFIPAFLHTLPNEMATKTPAELKATASQYFANHGIQLEYLEFADGVTLQPIHSWNDSSDPRAFIAAYAGKVRLIDNVSLNPKE